VSAMLNPPPRRTTAAASSTGIGRWQTPALAIGVIGAVLSVIGFFVDPLQFSRSYLPSYLFWFEIAAGALTVQMLQYITGGQWGLMIRRPLGAAGRTLPWLALLFVPVILGIKHTYPWANPEVVRANEALSKTTHYLNPTGFIVRAAVYFAIMIGFALMLRRYARQFAETRSPYVDVYRRGLSAFGVLVMVLVLTFVSIDWQMSLEAGWTSTIFGISFVVSCGLSAFAFVVFLLSRLASTGAMAEILRPSHLRDLGNLTLAFIMLWAYTSFSQFLLIWYANIKEEIPYYVMREHGVWGWIAAVLIIFHFFVPFFMLLMRSIKDRPTTIGALALVILVMRYVDIYWLTAPSYYSEIFRYSWMDLATLLGIGGLWVWLFIGQLKGQTIVPIHETWVEEALREGAIRHA
jgi:hypothetical protein